MRRLSRIFVASCAGLVLVAPIASAQSQPAAEKASEVERAMSLDELLERIAQGWRAERTANKKREAEFRIESYLHYQGERFVERFDANSYLYLTKAMDYFDLAENYGSLETALGRTKARFLIASYTTDWLFPTSQSNELVSMLVQCGKHVTFLEFDSPYGHDSFLIEREVERLESLVTPFLDQTYTAR